MSVSSTDFEELKRMTIKNLFSQDGLMRFNKMDKRPPYQGAKRKTVSNDNGILLAVYFYFLLHVRGLLEDSDRDRFYFAVNNLQIETGLHSPNPKRKNRYMSLDNDLAIMCGSVLFKTTHAVEKVNYGLEHGWIFDNLCPGSANYERSRQPAEIGFYKIAVNFLASFVQLICFLGSILFNAFQGFDKPGGPSNTSEHLTMWLRLITLGIVRDPTPIHGLLKICEMIWVWRLKVKTKGVGIEAVFNRFFLDKDLHPIEVLSTGVVFDRVIRRTD